MPMKKRLNKIIQKALKQTVEEFNGSSPAIYMNFFYGAVEIAPHHLVVWYLFATDKELQEANENGLCSKLIEATVHNLIAAGYPAEAFSETYSPLNDKITFEGGTTEEINDMFYALTHPKARVAFTTHEDIERKAHGDYHLYFQ